MALVEELELLQDAGDDLGILEQLGMLDDGGLAGMMAASMVLHFGQSICMQSSKFRQSK